MYMSRRRLIINADDFGMSAQNNAAIIDAHRHGVLTSASLMVGGIAAQEAAELARQHPSLAVGLHVNFSDTRPCLPPEQIPLLVQSDGYFPPTDHAHRRALLSVAGRRQIRSEIAAQFRAYDATGLPWDHVNGHRHIQKYPLLGWMLFQEARRWPVKMTRIPWDPPTDVARHLRAFMLWRLAAMYGLGVPDRSICHPWSVDHLMALLSRLPCGTTELYFHPGHRMYKDDLSILLDKDVKGALSGLPLSGYTASHNHVRSRNRLDIRSKIAHRSKRIRKGAI